MNKIALKANWKIISTVVSFAISVVTAAFVIDDRYAHSDHVIPRIEVVEHRSTLVVRQFHLAIHEHKMILDYKEANGTIKPSEKVTLTNYNEIIEALR